MTIFAFDHSKKAQGKTSIEILVRRFDDHGERKQFRTSIEELFKHVVFFLHELVGLGGLFGFYGIPPFHCAVSNS